MVARSALYFYQKQIRTPSIVNAHVLLTVHVFSSRVFSVCAEAVWGERQKTIAAEQMSVVVTWVCARAPRMTKACFYSMYDTHLAAGATPLSEGINRQLRTQQGSYHGPQIAQLAEHEQACATNSMRFARESEKRNTPNTAALDADADADRG